MNCKILSLALLILTSSLSGMDKKHIIPPLPIKQLINNYIPPEEETVVPPPPAPLKKSVSSPTIKRSKECDDIRKLVEELNTKHDED